MKSNSTTEERAEAHLNGRKPIIESFASQEKLSNDAKRSILFHCYKDYYDGATEQKAIDNDHLREVKKMLIKKACDAHCRICDCYSCCPYEFEIEGCYERNEILKAMEE